MNDVVLMYHRVAALESDVYGLSVDPARFEQHVEHLSRLRCTVPLTDLLQPSRATRIAITFDDGYEDNATIAAPLLAAAGLPATYFITTGPLGGGRFWWDRLAEVFMGGHPLPLGVELTLEGRTLWLALNDADARHASLFFLHRRVRPQPPEVVEATVSHLFEQLGIPAPVDDDVAMTVEQLRVMADLPLVDIGAHSRTHLQLGGQREALQRQEILGSVTDVATILERPVTSFAYPFGTHTAVGAEAPRLVRDAGCTVACTTERGRVTERSKPHELPRMNVSNWTGAEFATRVARMIEVG